MRAIAAAGLFLLAACGPEPEFAPNLTANQIEKIAGVEREPPEPVATAQPEPLLARDAAGQPRAACIFARAPFVLFYATPGPGLIRIQGQLRYLPRGGPLANSGGFYDDGVVAVSIGRADESAARRGPGRWPARMSVRNRRTGVRLVQQGEWACGVLAAAVPNAEEVRA